MLDAERTLVGSRQQLVQADVTLTNDVLALYDALGGGWRQDAATSQAPVIATTSPVTPAELDSVAGGSAALADQPGHGYTSGVFDGGNPVNISPLTRNPSGDFAGIVAGIDLTKPLTADQFPRSRREWIVTRSWCFAISH